MKEDRFPVLLVGAFLILWCLLAYSAQSTIIQKQREIDRLEDKLESNYMILEMDESCATQIKNNSDGVIRLKLGK